MRGKKVTFSNFDPKLAVLDSRQQTGLHESPNLIWIYPNPYTPKIGKEVSFWDICRGPKMSDERQKI